MIKWLKFQTKGAHYKESVTKESYGQKMMCLLKWWGQNVVDVYVGSVLDQPHQEEVGPTFHVIHWLHCHLAKRPIEWLNWKIHLPSQSRGIRSKSPNCMRNMRSKSPNYMRSIRSKSPKHWPKQSGNQMHSLRSKWKKWCRAWESCKTKWGHF